MPISSFQDFPVLPAFFLYVICPLIVFYIYRHVVIVPDRRCCLVERFGRFCRVAGPGVHILHPFESIRSVRWDVVLQDERGKAHLKQSCLTMIPTEPTSFDLMPSETLTSDGLSATLDGILMVQICDVRRAVYDIDNVMAYISSVASSSVRKAIRQRALMKLYDEESDLCSEIVTGINKTISASGMVCTSFIVQRLDMSSVTSNQIRDLQTKMQAERLLTSQVEEIHKRKLMEATNESQLADIRRRINEHDQTARIDSIIRFAAGLATPDTGMSPEAIARIVQSDIWAKSPAKVILAPMNNAVFGSCMMGVDAPTMTESSSAVHV